MIFAAHDVTYSYDEGILALDQVNLEVNDGEQVAILGANGSGKSTLIKILDGLYFPDEGEVFAFDQPLREADFQNEQYSFAFRRRVGLLFQDSDVQLFSPSVWDEVAFAPLQLGLDRKEVIERVDYALKALRIETLQQRPPHRLSGGEKKRVALASLLSLDPQVWLMDEPTAGLDPRSSAWLSGFIIDQRRRGKTVVIATHDLKLVSSVANRVYVFNEAHNIVADGNPQEILEDYKLLASCNLV